jgi:hypothetical protein
LREEPQVERYIEVVVLDAQTGKTVANLPGQTDFGFSANSQRMVTHDQSGDLIVWELPR